MQVTRALYVDCNNCVYLYSYNSRSAYLAVDTFCVLGVVRQLMGVVDVNMAGWRGTYKHVLKLEIVGDARVGKTCLATRFGEYNFLERYHPTMGK